MWIKKQGKKWVKRVYVVCGLFEGTWEDMCESDVKQEAKNDVQAYRENDPKHSYALVNRWEEIEPPTNVVYRLLEGQVIAIFPHEPANPGMMQSYTHLGQHSECTDQISKFTKAIHDWRTNKEVKALRNELTQLGYVLNVQQRVTRRP